MPQLDTVNITPIFAINQKEIFAAFFVFYLWPISLQEFHNMLSQVVIVTSFSSGGSQRQAASRYVALTEDVPEEDQLKAKKAATVQ